jgi:hypothetical protein
METRRRTQRIRGEGNRVKALLLIAILASGFLIPDAMIAFYRWERRRAELRRLRD